jgi:hypothetical protein
MSDDTQCTELGCMTPAQVVRCAEDSNTYCWIGAKMIADDGTEVAYECCGGEGRQANFRRRHGGAPAESVSPAAVPDGLIWSRRLI